MRSETRKADEAEKRICAMLEADRLPSYLQSFHDPRTDSLELRWGHGLSMHFDLAGEIEPFDDEDRRAILGLGLGEAFPLPAADLIDLAWWLDEAQLREAFRRLRDEGVLSPHAVLAERARLGDQLTALDRVIAEYCEV